jgi:hemerythrin-like domain-containing protein
MSNQPNIGEIVILHHKIITRGLKVSLKNVNEFILEESLDGSKQEGFLKYVQSFSSLLEGHHLVENEKIFPYFKDKLPEVPYERLIAEHEVLKAALEEINRDIASLRSETDELMSLNLIKSGLDKIDQIWHPHIKIEESQLYQQVGSLGINLEEMKRIGNDAAQFFQEHTGPAYLIAPFALYNLSPEDRAIVAQGFPEMVTKQLIPIDWKDKWAPMKPYLLN